MIRHNKGLTSLEVGKIMEWLWRILSVEANGGDVKVLPRTMQGVVNRAANSNIFEPFLAYAVNDVNVESIEKSYQTSLRFDNAPSINLIVAIVTYESPIGYNFVYYRNNYCLLINKDVIRGVNPVKSVEAFVAIADELLHACEDLCMESIDDFYISMIQEYLIVINYIKICFNLESEGLKDINLKDIIVGDEAGAALNMLYNVAEGLGYPVTSYDIEGMITDIITRFSNPSDKIFYDITDLIVAETAKLRDKNKEEQDSTDESEDEEE